MGSQALEHLRAGLEATVGTPITPTKKIYYQYGGAQHNQSIGTILPQEAWSSRVKYQRMYAGLQRNTFDVAFDATYTQIGFWLNLAVEARAAGTLSDTTAYTYTYSGSSNTAMPLKSATLQFSTTDLMPTVGWSIPGVYADELSITWKKAVGDAVTGVTGTAKLVTAYGATQLTAYTGTGTDVAQVNALGTLSQTYIDVTGGTIGTTPDSTVTEATFAIQNHGALFDAMDATSLAQSYNLPNQRDAVLTIQRRFDDKTELDRYIDKATRLVRIKTTGGLAGSSSVVYTLQLDTEVGWTETGRAYVDGLWVQNLTGIPIQSTGLNDFKFTVINKNATET